MLAKNASQRVARPSDVVSALAPLCAGSKLIGLLREARAKAKQAEDEPSHQEAEGLQVCVGVNASGDELAPRQPPDEPAAAAADFNPYHRWLGIAPAEQPADHYRLLGIPRFESDPEVIRDAATRQMAHVRTYHLGPHAELSQKILNELGMAKACLLDPQKKAVYDAALRAGGPRRNWKHRRRLLLARNSQPWSQTQTGESTNLSRLSDSFRVLPRRVHPGGGPPWE